MNNQFSNLSKQWLSIAQHLDLEVIAPYSVTFQDGTTVLFDVLLKNFGGTIGILIDSDYEKMKPYSKEFIPMGYGYSTIGEPDTENVHEDRLNGIIDILSDWDWFGPEEHRPEWLAHMHYLCPCCSYRTLHESPPGTFLICPVCYWEDDTTQYNDPDYRGGANEVSLNQAKENYRSFGAIQKQFVSMVRNPTLDEMNTNDK